MQDENEVEVRQEYFINIDTIEPTIFGAENGKWYNEDVTLYAKDNESGVNEFGLDSYYSSKIIDLNSPNFEDNGNTVETYVNEGYYCVRVRDICGNMSEYLYFQIDKTAPTTDIPTATVTTNSIEVTCNQKENLSGIKSVQYAIYEDGKWRDYQDSNRFEGLTHNKTYKVKTKVTDNAGNYSESEILTIKTNELKVGTLTLKLNNADGINYNSGMYTSQDVYVELNALGIGSTTYASKTGSSQKVEQTSSPVTITEEGITTLVVTTTDGINKVTKEYIVKISKNEPSSPYIYYSPNIFYFNSDTIGKLKASAGIERELAEKDNISYVKLIITDEDRQSTNVEKNINELKEGDDLWTDDDAANAAAAVGNEGTFYLKAWTENIYGAKSKENIIELVYDITPPNTEAPTAISTTNSITVTSNQTDDLSGIGKVEYSICKNDVWSNWQESETFTGLTENTQYEVKTRATDNAGNVEESMESYTISTKKLEIGSLTLTKESGDEYKVGDWTRENVIVTVNGTNDSMTSYYSTEDSSQQVTDTTFSTKITEEGTTTLVLKTEDGTNEPLTQKYRIRIDKTVPEIAEVTKSTEEKTMGNVTLTINGAEDKASGLAENAYSFDGGITWQKENSKIYTDNELKIKIKVKDKAGNIYTHSAIDVNNIYKNTYTISYNLNGGSLGEGVINPASYTVETESFTLNNPYKQGYVFTGWTGTNGETPQKSVTINKGTTGNLSYTANWTESTNVEYVEYKEERYLMNTDGKEYTKQEITKSEKTGTEVTISTEAPEGFTYDSTNSENVIRGNIVADGSTVLKVYFNRNKYQITIDDEGKTEKTEGEGEHYYDEEITLKVDVKPGYTFENWTIDGKFISEENPVTIKVPAYPKKNVVIKANIGINTYKISYNLNGGSLGEGVTNPESYTVETENFKLNNPSKQGYIFTGWTSTNGETPQKDITINKGTIGDLSYNANWDNSKIPEAEGLITFYDKVWNNQKASVKMKTESDYIIEYQINGKDGKWIKGNEVSELSLGDTIYARLTDGINVGEPKAYVVLDNKKPSKPTFEIVSGNEIGTNAYKGTVVIKINQGIDKESGIKETKYTINNKQETIVTKDSNITLTENDTYIIKAVSVDNAGNKSEEAIKTLQITEEKYFTSDIYVIEEETLYISRIQPNTKCEEFKKHIFTNMEYEVNDQNDLHTMINISKNGQTVVKDELIKTGDILTVGGKKYNLVVKGDVNKDGQANISDLAKMKKHIIQEKTLVDIQKKAADINVDEDVNLTDLAKIVKYIIKIIETL